MAERENVKADIAQNQESEQSSDSAVVTHDASYLQALELTGGGPDTPNSSDGQAQELADKASLDAEITNAVPDDKTAKIEPEGDVEAVKEEEASDGGPPEDAPDGDAPEEASNEDTPEGDSSEGDAPEGDASEGDAPPVDAALAAVAAAVTAATSGAPIEANPAAAMAQAAQSAIVTIAPIANLATLPTQLSLGDAPLEQGAVGSGPSPIVQHTALQSELDAVLGEAQQQLSGLEQHGTTLRQQIDAEGLGQTTQIDAAGSTADAQLTTQFSSAEQQVTGAGQAARAGVQQAAQSARSGVTGAHQRQRQTTTATQQQVMQSLSAKLETAKSEVSALIEAKAIEIEQAGKAKGEAAGATCDTLAEQFRSEGGNARERLRGRSKAEAATRAKTGYIQQFSAAGAQIATAARAQTANADQLLAAFFQGLIARLEGGTQQAQARGDVAADQAQQDVGQTQTTTAQAIERSQQQRSAQLRQGSAEARAHITGQVAEARDEFAAQNQLIGAGSEQAIAGAHDAHSGQVQAIQEGIEAATGRPGPMAQARLQQVRGDLSMRHQAHVQGIAQHADVQRREAGARSQHRITQTQQATAQRGQQATQEAAAGQAEIQQHGAQFGQQLTTMDQQVQSTVSAFGTGVDITLGNIEAEADTGVQQIKDSFTTGLDAQKTALETQLDQHITGISAAVSQAGNRAAEQKIQALNSKSTAVRNACDGFGTDESAIMSALGGLSADESAVVQEIYQDHYGRSLSGELESELSGDDLREARAHLSGNRVQGTIEALNNAISWSGDDEAAVEAALRRLTPEELEQLHEQMANDPRAAAIMERVRDNLGGHDLDVTDALLEGNSARADAIRLHEAMDGMGTDEDAVYRLLESAPDEASRQAIEAEFARYSKQEDGGDATTLRAAIQADFSGAEEDLSISLLDGDRVGAQAARLEIAADGMGTDEDAIFKQLNDPRLQSADPQVRAQAEADRARLNTLYEERYGRSLETMISNEMGDASDEDNFEAQMATQYLDRGDVDPALAIRYSVDGAGTLETRIQDTLRGKSAAEIEQIRRDYRERYGRDLDEELAGELSGDEGHEVDILMMGRPETPEQFMAIARARYEFQRGGDTSVMDGFGAIGATESGEILDANMARLEKMYASTDWDSASSADQQRLRELTGFVGDDAASYQAAKDSITDGVVTAIELVGAVVATIVTAGAASPLLAAVVCAGVTGAVTIAARAAIQGGSYGSEDLLSDAAMTGVAMLTAGIGNSAKVTAAAGRWGTTLAQRIPNAGPWLETGMQQAIEGAIGGGIDSFGQSLFNEQAWDQGAEHWAASVASGTGQGIASGFGSGMVTGGAEGMWGEAATAGRAAIREGIGNMAGDATALLVNPEIYSQDFDEILRGLASQMPQSFGTGAAGGYGAHHARRRAAQRTYDGGVPHTRGLDEGAAVPPHHETAPEHHETAPEHHETAPEHHETAPEHHETAPEHDPTQMGASHASPEGDADTHLRTSENAPRIHREAEGAIRQLGAEGASEVRGLISGAENPAQASMIQRALAAGSSLDDVRTLAASMQGKSEAAILREYTGAGLQQHYQESCVPTSWQIARAEVDPVYAQQLSNDPTRVMQEQRQGMDDAGGRSIERRDEQIRDQRTADADLAALHSGSDAYNQDGTAGIEPTLMQGQDAHAALEAATGREYEVHNNGDITRWQHGEGAPQFEGGQLPHHRIQAALDAGLPVPLSQHTVLGAHQEVVTGYFHRDGEVHYVVHDPMSGQTHARPASMYDSAFMTPTTVTLPRLTLREKLTARYARGALGDLAARFMGMVPGRGGDTHTSGQNEVGGHDETTQHTGDNPLQMPLDALLADPEAQQQLLEQAHEAHAEIRQTLDTLESSFPNAEILSGLKRSDLASFIAAVQEKVQRKGYSEVGDMGDMIRGRIEAQSGDDVHAIVEHLREVFPTADIDIKDGPYPRVHADIPTSNGMHFELQIGTAATTQFLESAGVRLPSDLAARVGSDQVDFHVAKYDILDKMPDDLRTEYGMDALDARYNEMLRATGTGNFDVEGHTQISADIQRVLERMAADHPATLLGLYTKGAHPPANANMTETGGRTPSPEQMVAEIQSAFGDRIRENPLRQEYEARVAALALQGETMRANGATAEEIARTLHQARRDLGHEYKDLTPQALRDFIFYVNSDRYGDPLGPSFEFLMDKYGSDFEKIISGSTRPNGDVDRLLASFGTWLAAQPADYIQTHHAELAQRLEQDGAVLEEGPGEEP